MSKRTARGGIRRAALKVWRADPRGAALAALLQVLGAVSGLGVVIASKLALDAILAGDTDVSGPLLSALILVAGTTALSTSIVAFQQLQQRLLAEKVDQVIWTELLATTASVDLVTWQSSEFIARLERVRDNALQRPTQVVAALFSLAGATVGALGLTVALFTLEPLLIPVLLSAGVPVVVLSRLASKREFAYARHVNETMRRRWYLRRLLIDRSFAAEVRAFDALPYLIHRHGQEGAALVARLRRHVRVRQGLALASTLSSALLLSLALVVIVVLVQRGQLTLPEAGAAAIAARLLGGQFGGVFSALATLIEAGPFLADLEDFHSSAAPISPPQAARPLRHAMTLTNVGFSYEGMERPAVDGVSICIPAGCVVALVGENGSGKSTLAKIAAGLYEPQVGEVAWDDDATISAAQLRAGVSVLFQDFVRYQMTGAENITIAQSSEPLEEGRMIAAASRAGIHAALSELPDGYDTVLGLELASGADLSGGQWQRLALARAFYRDTPVIVLDEPTASLDPKAEHELFQDVRRILDGRSALLISHRFSSVRLADYIYVMHEGRIVEEGTHQHLMSVSGGRYAELYTLQAKAYL